MRTHPRLLLSSLALVITATAATSAVAQKKYASGVTDNEIKIGQTMPYSGPASAWGTVGLAELAYIKMINEQGGIRGRKITLISLDDSFSSPKTVEQTRKAGRARRGGLHLRHSRPGQSRYSQVS